MIRNPRAFAKRAAGVVLVFGVLFGGFALLRTTMTASGLTPVTAEFDSVIGLVEQSDVTLAGANVGQVSKIDTTEDGRRAKLTISVEPEVAKTLKADATAQVRLKSLLGELYVDITRGSADKPLDDLVIDRTSSDLTIDELLGTLGGTLGDVKEAHVVGRLVQQISSEFEGQGDALESIAQNSTELIKAISFRADSIARIINNIDILTESLDGRAAVLGESISSAARSLAELRGNLSKNVETMNNSVIQLKTMLEGINTSPMNQALSEIPIWIEKVERVVGVLQDLIEGRRPVTAVFASIAEQPDGILRQLEILGRNPMIRDALLGMLKQACPTPETPGCAP